MQISAWIFARSRMREALSRRVARLRRRFPAVDHAFALSYDRLPRNVCVAGVRLRIGSHLSSRIVRSIMRGHYEGAERVLLKSTLLPDDRVLELGTGIGFLTVFCARTVGPERVLNYEANPALEKHIRRTFQLNGVAPTLRIAIAGAADGQRALYVSRSFWASSTVKSGPKTKAVDVPVTSINHVTREFRPTVVIMDVEGGEAELVPIMDFDGVRAVVIELHPAVIGEQATSMVLRTLRQRGFEEAGMADQSYLFTSTRLTPEGRSAVGVLTFVLSMARSLLSEATPVLSEATCWIGAG